MYNNYRSICARYLCKDPQWLNSVNKPQDILSIKQNYLKCTVPNHQAHILITGRPKVEVNLIFYVNNVHCTIIL